MTAVLADALRDVVDHLGGARFIGRHPGTVETDAWSRWYLDPDDPQLRYQSVTWTLGSTEWSPWLPGWAAGLSAEQTAEHWADLGDMAAAVGWAQAVAWLRSEGERQRDLAAAVGTWHHDVLEALLLDAAIPDPPGWVLGCTLKTGGERIVITQEALDDWASGLLNFITDFRLVPVMAEASVCNPVFGYAGRVDLGAEFPGLGLGLVDLKSGQPRASVMAQLTALIRASEVWLPLGERVEMPRFEWGAVLHLRGVWERGYKLTRVPTGPDQWAWFERAVRLLQAREGQPKLGRGVLYPPAFDDDGHVVGIPDDVMVEDLPIGAARTALREAGFRWLSELAGFRADEIQSDPKRGVGVKGVGPKTIEALAGLLAEHRMAFADAAAAVA